MLKHFFQIKMKQNVESPTGKINACIQLEKFGSRKSTVGTQNSEVGTQKSEFRTQKSELRSRNSEVGTQKSELRSGPPRPS